MFKALVRDNLLQENQDCSRCSSLQEKGTEYRNVCVYVYIYMYMYVTCHNIGTIERNHKLLTVLLL